MYYLAYSNIQQRVTTNTSTYGNIETILRQFYLIFYLISTNSIADSHGKSGQLDQALSLSINRPLLQVDKLHLKLLLLAQSQQHGGVVAIPRLERGSLKVVQLVGL